MQYIYYGLSHVRREKSEGKTEQKLLYNKVMLWGCHV